MLKYVNAVGKLFLCMVYIMQDPITTQFGDSTEKLYLKKTNIVKQTIIHKFMVKVILFISRKVIHQENPPAPSQYYQLRHQI